MREDLVARRREISDESLLGSSPNRDMRRQVSYLVVEVP